MPLKHYGNATISRQGQAGIPVDLRRALGIEDQSCSVQVFADLEKREIRLIEDDDPERLYELMQRANQASGPRP